MSLFNIFKKKEDKKKVFVPNSLSKVLNFLPFIPLAILLGALLGSNPSQPEPLKQEFTVSVDKMNIWHQVGEYRGEDLYNFLLSQGYDLYVEKEDGMVFIDGFTPAGNYILVMVHPSGLVEDVSMSFDYKRFRKRDLNDYEGRGVYFDDGDFYGYRINFSDGTTAENYIDREDKSLTIARYITR